MFPMVDVRGQDVVAEGFMRSFMVRDKRHPLRFAKHFFGSAGSGARRGLSRVQMVRSDWSCSSNVLSISARRLSIAALVASCSRVWANARTTYTLIVTACGIFNTIAAMIAPCSVKAWGGNFACCPRFKVTVCDLKAARPPAVKIPCAFKSLNSAALSAKMKSGGKRSAFRRTAYVSARA